MPQPVIRGHFAVDCLPVTCISTSTVDVVTVTDDLKVTDVVTPGKSVKTMH
jgi:hypothetical protein